MSDSEGWWITHKNRSLRIGLPTARTAVRFSQKSIETRLSFARDKYRLPGFIDVVEGDRVVDIGAFIGEFSLSIADKADCILAIEPDPRSFRALERTARQFDNLCAQNYLLWNENTELNFSVATDGSESSVAEPNVGPKERVITKQAVRLDTVVGDKIDFVKVEAEGAELEIIQGFEKLNIEKIAVDCSESSPFYDRTPEAEIADYLQERGYDVEVIEDDVHRTMVFANRG